MSQALQGFDFKLQGWLSKLIPLLSLSSVVIENESGNSKQWPLSEETNFEKVFLRETEADIKSLLTDVLPLSFFKLKP